MSWPDTGTQAHVVVTDDVVTVVPWSRDAEADFELTEHDEDGLPPLRIDLDYLAVALSQTIAQGGYLYEASSTPAAWRNWRSKCPWTRKGSQTSPGSARSRRWRNGWTAFAAGSRKPGPGVVPYGCHKRRLAAADSGLRLARRRW